MFPICDINGNTVAFTARVSPDREGEEKMGKYINSPQTLIYDKSRIYSAWIKREGDKKEECGVIMEGQMDVIAVISSILKMRSLLRGPL